MQRLVLLVIAPVFILGAGAPADDFYLSRLAAGKAEAISGRHYEAIADFRIASFGFLDQPALLVEGLARLALAQEAAGRKDDTEETLRRFVEVETRFDVWGQADVEPAARTAFAALLQRRLGAEAAKVLVTPVAAAPPALVPTPTPAPPAVAVPAVAAIPTPAPLPTPEPTRAARPAGPDSAAVLAESRTLLAQGRYVENLRKLVVAVAANPKDRELRKALLEGATLTKDWKTAIAQLESLRPFREGEEAWMFYAAIALHETGGTGTREARDLTERALPRLSRTPFVDYYARRILETAPKR